jgi:hypothetical protein
VGEIFISPTKEYNKDESLMRSVKKTRRSSNSYLGQRLRRVKFILPHYALYCAFRFERSSCIRSAVHWKRSAFSERPARSHSAIANFLILQKSPRYHGVTAFISAIA